MKRLGLLATVSLLVLTGCVAKSDYLKQKQLAQRLQGLLDASRKEARGLKGKIGDLDKRLASLNSQLKGVVDDAAKMKSDFRSKMAVTRQEFEKKLAEARKEADAQAKMFTDLKNRFKKLIQAGNLSIRILHGRLVLKLRSAVLFDAGKIKLKRAGRKALKDIAAVLKTIPDKHFQVAGHTDNIPCKRSRFENNWDLSAARAVQVVTFLEKEGVPGKNLSAAGFSQHQPVARNASPDGRKSNRRIEISLLPSIPSQLIE